LNHILFHDKYAILVDVFAHNWTHGIRRLPFVRQNEGIFYKKTPQEKMIFLKWKGFPFRAVMVSEIQQAFGWNVIGIGGRCGCRAYTRRPA